VRKWKGHTAAFGAAVKELAAPELATLSLQMPESLAKTVYMSLTVLRASILIQDLTRLTLE
jgi:hypothetical protein